MQFLSFHQQKKNYQLLPIQLLNLFRGKWVEAVLIIYRREGTIWGPIICHNHSDNFKEDQEHCCAIQKLLVRIFDLDFTQRITAKQAMHYCKQQLDLTTS